MNYRETWKSLEISVDRFCGLTFMGPSLHRTLEGKFLKLVIHPELAEGTKEAALLRQAKLHS